MHPDETGKAVLLKVCCPMEFLNGAFQPWAC
jgi:hypothetical protein